MENQLGNNIEDQNRHTTANVENDYDAHQSNPAPAPTVNEPDNKGAGQALKWIIPIVIVVLLILWFVLFRNNVTK